MTATTRSAAGRRASTGSRLWPWTASSRTPGAFIKCMGTSGSGARMSGTTATDARRRTDRPGSRAAMQVAVWSAAVPGTTFRRSSARPSASGSPPTTGATTSASGWPSLRDARLGHPATCKKAAIHKAYCPVTAHGSPTRIPEDPFTSWVQGVALVLASSITASPIGKARARTGDRSLRELLQPARLRPAL